MRMLDLSKHVSLNQLEVFAHLALGGTIIDSWTEQYHWDDKKEFLILEDPIKDRYSGLKVDDLSAKGFYRKKEDDIYSLEKLLELAQREKLKGSAVFACLALGGTIIDQWNQKFRWSEKKEQIVRVDDDSLSDEHSLLTVTARVGDFFGREFRRVEEKTLEEAPLEFGQDEHVNIVHDGEMYIAVSGEPLIRLIAHGIILHGFKSNETGFEKNTQYVMKDGILFVHDVKSGEIEPSPIYFNELREYQLHYLEKTVKERGLLVEGDVASSKVQEPMSATEVVESLGSGVSYETAEGKTFSEEEMMNLPLKDLMEMRWVKPQSFELTKELLKNPDQWVARGRWLGNLFKIGFDSKVLKVVIAHLDSDSLPVYGTEGVTGILLHDGKFTELVPIKNGGSQE